MKVDFVKEAAQTVDCVVEDRPGWARSSLLALLSVTSGRLAHIMGAQETAETLRRIANMLAVNPAAVIPPAANMRVICAKVAEKHGLTVDELRRPCAKRKIAHARFEAMHAMYATGKYSLPQIAAFLGGMHHTSILHGIRAHGKRMGEGA